jgi:hypothetical protein
MGWLDHREPEEEPSIKKKNRFTKEKKWNRPSRTISNQATSGLKKEVKSMDKPVAVYSSGSLIVVEVGDHNPWLPSLLFGFYVKRVGCKVPHLEDELGKEVANEHGNHIGSEWEEKKTNTNRAHNPHHYQGVSVSIEN